MALNLQLEFYYNDAIGPIFPRITSYIDGTSLQKALYTISPFDSRFHPYASRPAADNVCLCFSLVMTTAPFPLNSILLVTIALGVSNVILRAWDHGNAPDWLLCVLTAGGLVEFISRIVSQQVNQELTLLHRAEGPLAEVAPFLLALFYLLCMLYLSFLSSKAEVSADLGRPASKPSINLDPIRKELDAMRKRFSFPTESPRNGRR